MSKQKEMTIKIGLWALLLSLACIIVLSMQLAEMDALIQELQAENQRMDRAIVRSWFEQTYAFKDTVYTVFRQDTAYHWIRVK